MLLVSNFIFSALIISQLLDVLGFRETENETFDAMISLMSIFA